MHFFLFSFYIKSLSHFKAIYSTFMPILSWCTVIKTINSTSNFCSLKKHHIFSNFSSVMRSAPTPHIKKNSSGWVNIQCTTLVIFFFLFFSFLFSFSFSIFSLNYIDFLSNQIIILK